MADPFDYGVNYLSQRLNLTPEQARGAVRWFQNVESGLNPAAFNPAGGGQGALGIGQWRGPRQSALLQSYGRSPSIEQQFAFTGDELLGPEARALQSLRGAKTEDEAFRVFGRDFARPSPAEYAKATGGYSSGLRARPGPREGYYDDALHVTLRPREPEGIPLALLDELLGKSPQGEEKQQSPIELLDSLLGQNRPEEAKRAPATGEGDFIEPPGPVPQPETVIGTEPLKPTEMKPLADLPKPPGAAEGQAIDPHTVSRSDFIEPLGAGQETPSLVPPPAMPSSPEGVLDMLLRQASGMKPDLGQIGEQAAQGGADILQGLAGLAERARLGATNILRVPGTPPQQAQIPMGPGLRAAEGAITAATGGLLSPLATPVRGAGQIARGVSRETSAAMPSLMADVRGGVPREPGMPRIEPEAPRADMGGGGAPPAPPGEVPPAGGPPRPPSGPTGGGEAPRGGRISKAVASFKEVVNAAIRDAQIKGVPMAAGDDAGRAIAKDYANAERLARYRRMRWDKELRKLSPEDQRAMWEAMDNASVAAQQYGYEAGLRYLQTLPREQRALLAEMERDGIRLWEDAREAGLVADSAERLPFYIMRGVVEIGEDGSIAKLNARQGPGLSALDQFGVNLTTRGPRQREYLTAEQTEQAARQKFGEEARVVRNIRVLPMAYERFEKAIAGRRLINDLKEVGQSTGTEAVVEGMSGPNHFTIDHPAFKTFKPRFTKDAEGKVVPVRDQTGNIVFDKVPLYVSREFEGPLRAVMRHETGALYNAAMMVKAGAMATIMNSPVIHNMVEWGRALGAMPGRVATFKVYRVGSQVIANKALMERAIKDGLVPIGERGYLTDIEGIASASDLQPGRGMLAKGLGAATDLVSPKAGEAVRRGIDRAGDFWHQKLLWDQVAKLQAGLYNEFALDMVKKGVDRDVASKIAAHFANRFAGAVPNEAMSETARKTLNILLFSRSFTTGNLGVMKDMINGLPRDVQAQIGRNLTPLEQKAATGLARRKAIGTVLADVALMYASNAILQSAFNTLSGDRDLGAEGEAYVERMRHLLQRGEENPLSLVNPLSDIEDLMPTTENEPQRQERIKIGHAADGTAIYLRSPVGKIGEEFSGWATKPLQMLKNKEGTIARPLLNILNNDRGLGQKVYSSNPHGIADVAGNIGSVMWEFMRSQTPEIQLKAGMRLMTGKGDWVDALQFGAPFFGGTISRGAPGGEQVGELYQARGEHEEKVKAALPEIRQLVKDGKTEEAEKRLGELKMPRQLQRYYMKVFSNPEARLSPRAMKDFERYATPEQKRRMEMQRNQRDLRQGTGTP